MNAIGVPENIHCCVRNYLLIILTLRHGQRCGAFINFTVMELKGCKSWKEFNITAVSETLFMIIVIYVYMSQRIAQSTSFVWFINNKFKQVDMSIHILSTY